MSKEMSEFFISAKKTAEEYFKQEKRNIICSMAENSLIIKDSGSRCNETGIYARLRLDDISDVENCVIAINCDKSNTRPCAKTGQGINAMSGYCWIPIVCIIEGRDGKQVENYELTFLQQDIDLKTGNFHFHMNGEMQLWKDLIVREGTEAGGDINPRPEKDNDSYIIRYTPINAYPIAVTEYCRRQSFNSIKDLPWGYTADEIGVDRIPEMSLSEEDYSTESMADFILKLIRTDIVKKIG